MENTQIVKADALDTSSIKFDVVLEPMKTVTGAKVPADLRRAVKNKNTGEVIGTCGKNYKPTAYYHIAELVNQGLRKSNLDLSDITVIDNLYDNGAKWHRKIQFNKIEKSLAKKDDIIKLELNIHSSLDLSRKISSIFGAIRLWCLNGCVTSDYNIRRHFKQTLGLNPTWLAENSVNALVSFENNKLLFDKMLATSVTDEEVSNFFKDPIAKLGTPSGNMVDGYIYHSKTKLTNLLNRYKKEKVLQGKGSTLWSVYNTLTNYSTHVGSSDWCGTELNEFGQVVTSELTGRKHNLIYSREQEVAKSLNHPLFNKMVA